MENFGWIWNKKKIKLKKIKKIKIKGDEKKRMEMKLE